MTLTLRESLAASPLPRLEAHLLWQRVLGVTRAWLIAHDADPLDPARVAAYRALEARRAAGEPIAYILGHREFFGRDFQVTPAVLIPRPDTELLVECGLRAIRDVREPHVLDLGTGSGIVAVTLALERPDARVRATDLSAEALDVARKNARDLGAKLLFSHGNWYDTELGSARFDLIVSNPPYIDARDAHLGRGDLRFEPRGALTDEADGLRALRAPPTIWLRAGSCAWNTAGTRRRPSGPCSCTGGSPTSPASGTCPASNASPGAFLPPGRPKAKSAPPGRQAEGAAWGIHSARPP